MSKAVTRALAFALLLGGLVLVVATSAGAEKAKQLGKTKSTPDPACPENSIADPCEAVGSVTGIQVKADGKSGLMKMPVDGKIVAFSVDLSKPTKKQRKFFASIFANDKFGNDPSARISVLKKLDRKHFKLTAQSRAVNLSSYLGQKPVITINKPLRAAKDRFVALTVPTWLSSLAVAGAGAGNSQWRASRPSDKCGAHAAKNSHPQQNVDSVRVYGCRFTDRLLYWAYYVPS
jgi:hypothetical protein